jgi:hypothetical protein
VWLNGFAWLNGLRGHRWLYQSRYHGMA